MQQTKERKFLKIAHTIAQDVERVGNASLASLIVSKNTIISVGTNKKKSHPFQFKFSSNEHSIYLHAETAAIKNALKKISVEDLSKCTMYTSRALFDGTVAFAKPCKGCTMAIEAFNLKRVVYSIQGDQYGIL